MVQDSVLSFLQEYNDRLSVAGGIQGFSSCCVLEEILATSLSSSLVLFPCNSSTWQHSSSKQQSSCRTEHHLSWPQRQVPGTPCSLGHFQGCSHHLKCTVLKPLLWHQQHATSTPWRVTTMSETVTADQIPLSLPYFVQFRTNCSLYGPSSRSYAHI